MGRLVKIALGRSLLVGAAFTVTAVLMVLFGLTPERSTSSWGYVSLVLALLALFSGLIVTFWETRLR